MNIMAKKTEAPSLEQSLKRLEEIATLLDRGELSIDEQLKIYEEGMLLAQQCREYLEQAELKVRRLSGEDANAE
ncbi:MAG: exodeoxyribonuclease VII small subunit [Candidatus Kapabacteria bacterium]|nr:exodeoxyribonuclease VII small subunit [Ignavibacteria bacterium]MBP6509920.1 exodeoxyribonuclease VII small subunit [Candidatus Kapabacteria bacterium]MBK6418645.1 exodeoxyribonuclease VII small subunit [Ignavibacteria bacterium]MBK6760610.1 exodeoxyribonuclease VII small subunit [Ignavibacteria bacterium]MBK7032576.1 exodeoxyribonuclease VII small subunit [Ignavibacteria bacterium]